MFLTKEISQSREQYYYKSASTSDGIVNIKREIEGLDWYRQRSHRKYSVEIVLETERFIKTKHSCIDGKVMSVRYGYLNNLQLLESVIEHYIEVWSGSDTSGNCPVHGDLSFQGNVIFAPEGPYFIDWEHFKNSAAPIGFDALYFLFEFIALNFAGNYPGDKVISHMSGMMRLLENHKCLSDVFKTSPLESVIEFIQNDDLIWGEQKYKIPLKRQNIPQLESIDRAFNRESRLV